MIAKILEFLRNLFDRLPETTCETCLAVRTVAGKMIVAMETKASISLGLSVGEEVKNTPDDMLVCHCFPEVEPKEVISYRNRLGLSQRDFASRYGLSLRDIKEMERA